jgi:hypothetical protein
MVAITFVPLARGVLEAVLAETEQMVLYSLLPKMESDQSAAHSFHSYPILGESKVTDPQTVKEVYFRWHGGGQV